VHKCHKGSNVARSGKKTAFNRIGSSPTTRGASLPQNRKSLTSPGVTVKSRSSSCAASGDDDDADADDTDDDDDSSWNPIGSRFLSRRAGSG
jgi:hypothetical protein